MDLFFFDYDYNAPMEYNGQRLGDLLVTRFQSDDDVTLIAHSMGGLVARLGILSQPLPFVRGLFMLGTPNVGAIRVAQLSLLMDLATGFSYGVVHALFPRKQGILDLTRAADILERHRAFSSRADHIDYVSIPGLYYHESRSVWQWGKEWKIRIFSLLQFGFRFLNVVFPPIGIKLSRPHDGIVEMASNNLIPCLAGRESEKKNSINFPNTPVTYIHIEPDSCRGLTHVQVQSNRDVFEVIVEILLTPVQPGRSRLEDWWNGLNGSSRDRITRVQFRG
jgi:pimeloyl-ACP methyl ester carboxylesterase